MVIKVSDEINYFLELMDDVDNDLIDANAALQQADLETQDILHRLELYNDNAVKMTMLTKTLKEVRKERRIAKNAIDYYRPVADWKRDHKDLINQIKQLRNNVQKAEATGIVKHYTPRTDILKGEKW